MKPELDEQLCKKFPKIFRDRQAPITSSCMGWGLSVGDGWYNIINTLCSYIQFRIDWNKKTRVSAYLFNRALREARAGKIEKLKAHNTICGVFNEDYYEADFSGGPRRIEPKIPQVVATQVKEKYGGLRFYFNGGDEVIDGMVSMAEGLSEVTCEVCGAPGTREGSGWVMTRCEKHRKV